MDTSQRKQVQRALDTVGASWPQWPNPGSESHWEALAALAGLLDLARRDSEYGDEYRGRVALQAELRLEGGG